MNVIQLQPITDIRTTITIPNTRPISDGNNIPQEIQSILLYKTSEQSVQQLSRTIARQPIQP